MRLLGWQPRTVEVITGVLKGFDIFPEGSPSWRRLRCPRPTIAATSSHHQRPLMSAHARQRPSRRGVWDRSLVLDKHECAAVREGEAIVYEQASSRRAEWLPTDPATEPRLSLRYAAPPGTLSSCHVVATVALMQQMPIDCGGVNERSSYSQLDPGHSLAQI